MMEIAPRLPRSLPGTGTEGSPPADSPSPWPAGGAALEWRSSGGVMEVIYAVSGALRAKALGEVSQPDRMDPTLHHYSCFTSILPCEFAVSFALSLSIPDHASIARPRCILWLDCEMWLNSEM